jgi:hypothetical protein
MHGSTDLPLFYEILVQIPVHYSTTSCSTDAYPFVSYKVLRSCQREGRGFCFYPLQSAAINDGMVRGDKKGFPNSLLLSSGDTEKGNFFRPSAQRLLVFLFTLWNCLPACLAACLPALLPASAHNHQERLKWGITNSALGSSQCFGITLFIRISSNFADNDRMKYQILSY